MKPLAEILFGCGMRAPTGVPDMRDDSMKQHDEPRCRSDINRRKPPEKVVIGGIPERDNISHDPQPGPLGNPGIPGGGGEINEKNEGNLDLKDLLQGRALEPKEADTKIGHQATRKKEGKAEEANEDKTPLAIPEISAQVSLVRVEKVGQLA